MSKEKNVNVEEETVAEAGQIEELRAEVEKYKAMSEEYMQMAQRERADLENYRRRNASLRAEAYADGIKDCATRFLPAIDNLERALEAAEKDGQDNAITEGVRAINKQIISILADMDITPIEALNCKFDPTVHNAVLHTEEEGVEPETVTAVMQKGYMYKDKVLRYSMVKVTN